MPERPQEGDMAIDDDHPRPSQYLRLRSQCIRGTAKPLATGASMGVQNTANPTLLHCLLSDKGSPFIVRCYGILSEEA